MYSEKIIVQNLDKFAAREGWMPTPHTFAQVEEFKHYIDSIVKIESNSRSSYISLVRSITEKRRKEIWRWVENEQVMCALDSSYFDDCYAYVCNEGGEIFKFKNRKSQEVFDSVIADFDEKQVAIRLLILKARQVGITTKTALKFLQRMLFIPHTQAVMASVQSDKSELIGRILDIAYNQCPWWLVPRRLPKGAFDNGSVLSIQSGMQATGIAQGWTPTCIHLSELADIPKPKKVIEEGLLRATHATPNLFMVFEGTGGGNTGWLAETWRAAKEDFPKGLHDLCPVFIPWAMATDLYPEEAWIRQFPVPEDFYKKRMEVTRKHVIRAESYIRNTPFLSRIAGRDWRMPLEQQWFWEFNYAKSCKNHSQKIWLAQMPADDYEALTGVHDSVFDVETIQDIEDHIYEVQGGTKERKNPVQAYAITGDSIDDGFEPLEQLIDYDKAHIRVTWKSDRGQRYDWVLVPLLPIDEEVELETFDKLLVYEEPNPGYTYSCGIDTADGLGKEDEDRTVVSVTRNRFGDEYDYQVAELCLAEGSMVITPNGVKKIEEFVKGDEVIDRLGRTVEVSKTSNSDHDNSLSVWTAFSSSEPLKLTPDHQVSTAEGWKEAQNLKVGDWLRYPVRPLVEKPLPEIVLQKCRVSLCGESRDVTLHLNRDLGFACGLYLAEGCVGLSREGVIRHVAFTLHEREAGPWKEIIQRAFPDCHITEQAINQSHAHRLMISLKNVATWVADTFGRKEKKHVPSWVWNAPRAFVEGIVHGMVAGDGSIDRRCASVNYTSVLPSLVISLRELMLSLGWGIGVIRKQPRTIAQDVWAIQFYGETAEHFFIEDMIRVFPPSRKRRPPQFRWGWNKEWIYVKVRKIKESGGGKFYDLTVDGNDPSFCVLQAAVHNCSNRINSAQVVGFAACIAAWYGENAKDPRGVKFCVEQIGRPGDTCQHQLKLMGFHWHHVPRRYDSKKIKDDSGKKQGWYSNVWSVPILMTRFTEAVNGGWYRPTSRWLIEELKTLERHAAAGRISKLEHRSGQHDDRVRAAAQSFFTAHDFDILADRSQKRYALPTEKAPPLSKAVCSSNMVSVGGLD
jgi:hypothetical protein